MGRGLVITLIYFSNQIPVLTKYANMQMYELTFQITSKKIYLCIHSRCIMIINTLKTYFYENCSKQHGENWSCILLYSMWHTIAFKCFSQNVWADNNHPLGTFVYQTLNQTDFDFFNRNYPYSPRFQLGIGKPNISEANATSGYWDVSMQDLFKSKGNQDFTKQKHCGVFPYQKGRY